MFHAPSSADLARSATTGGPVKYHPTTVPRGNTETGFGTVPRERRHMRERERVREDNGCGHDDKRLV